MAGGGIVHIRVCRAIETNGASPSAAWREGLASSEWDGWRVVMDARRMPPSPEVGICEGVP